MTGRADSKDSGGTAPAVLAFDVGGTDLKAGIVLPSGEIVGLERHSTPRRPGSVGEAIIEKIAELTAAYKAEYRDYQLQAAGLVVPGLVDEVGGIGILSVNLGWRDFPFAARAQSVLGLPVAFGHDVGAAGEAEFRLGAAKGTRDAVILVVGTGIAAAVFSDGRRLEAGGYAGELGHAPVPDPDRPGSTAILEAVGSAGAIAARYYRTGGSSSGHGAREVLDLASGGDPLAQKVWNEAVDALAFAIAHCASVLGTETIVVGGGLSQAGDALLVPLEARTEALLTIQRRPHLVPALLGQNAGLIGAGLKAHDLLKTAQNEGSIQ